MAEALPVFEAAGDDLALRIAYRAIGESANMRAQADQVAAAYERASYTGPAGLTALVGYQSPRAFRLDAAPELLAWQDEQDPREPRSPGYGRIGAARSRCSAADDARALHAELRAELVERGGAKAVLAALQGSTSRSSFWAATRGRGRGR